MQIEPLGNGPLISGIYDPRARRKALIILDFRLVSRIWGAMEQEASMMQQAVDAIEIDQTFQIARHIFED